jgi:hypothetical protein
MFCQRSCSCYSCCHFLGVRCDEESIVCHIFDVGVFRGGLFILGSLCFTAEPACGLVMCCSCGITVRIAAFAVVYESEVGRLCGLTPRWSQRRLPLEFMDGLRYTTIIELAVPPARRRGSALDR